MNKFRMKAIYFVLFLLVAVGITVLRGNVIEASENKTNSPTVLVPYQEVTESGTYRISVPGRIEGYSNFFIKSKYDEKEYYWTYEDNIYTARIPIGDYEISIDKGNKIKFIPESSSEYEQEENDSFDKANLIIPNVMYKGSVKYNYFKNGDEDYYKIIISEKGSLYVELEKGDNFAKYQLYSELPDTNVVMISEQDFSYGTEKIKINKTDKVRVPKGVYYIKIISTSSDFNYSMKVVYSAEVEDEFELEKNDTKDTANKITVNKKYTGNLNEPVETEGRKIIDEDYYKFTLESTGKAQLQMVTPRQKAKGLFTAELLNENGKVLETIKSEDNPAVYGQQKVLGAGDYYIRVYSSDDRYDSHVDYAIMCAFEGRVLADKVKITSKKVKFKVGDKYILKAKVLPENVSDKTIIWKSLDKKIATVDKNGVLKCKKAGEVIIRATSKESQTIYDEMHIIVEKSKEKISSSAKSVIPEKIYNKIKGWYAENSSGGYNVKVTRDYFIKYDRETGKISSRWKIHKMKTKDNGYLFCVKYREMESSYFCEKSKLGEGFDHLYSWDGDWIGYSGSSSLSKGKWGSWGN